MDAPGSSYFCLVSTSRLLVHADFEITLISVNKSLKGKWASLACHETGSLVVQVYAQRVLYYHSIDSVG